jgi:hypothetical protein
VCKEIFDLLVEGCQIPFPVALSAFPDDVQQTRNLMCVHHKEGTYYLKVIRIGDVTGYCIRHVIVYTTLARFPPNIWRINTLFYSDAIDTTFFNLLSTGMQYCKAYVELANMQHPVGISSGC